MAKSALLPAACAPVAAPWRRAWLTSVCLAGFLVAGNAACATTLSAEPRHRVLALESEGRAHPRKSAAALAELLAGGSLEAAARVEVQTLQGWLLASVPDDEAAEGVARA